MVCGGKDDQDDSHGFDREESRINGGENGHMIVRAGCISTFLFRYPVRSQEVKCKGVCVLIPVLYE